ncbi:formimidoylglutamate deiminase [Alisedimentitalea sp. MJ-SS2]|uniref:formimidoylglutamate deiminase n=1 Tax=Aliisedimentitalea sp. MJ-SS2 TaxID=3049795 RepID=UPI00291051CF|nr:formimidoylglutamate deiminase [Alisedimentitalea sp. MJ-SS2]MDU8925851.1 formimidoylglutamate deiminase [Alisedimentitalea sp. MJ-SS2]
MQILHAGQALTPGGWQRDVEIHIGDDGRIASVAGQKGVADVRVDLALPAPVNLHSHTFQRAMAGLTESRGPDARDSFWTWRTLMYRFLERLTPEHVEAIAAQVFMESLEAGYGGVAEFHYLHHGPGGVAYDNAAEMADRVVAAAEEAGIGLTLLPVLYERGGCDGRALEGGQLRFGNDLERYGAVLEGTALRRADDRMGVAPHSLRAVRAESLTVVSDMVPEGPVHIHLAEQVAEVEEVLSHTGARPVEWLLGNAQVDRRWCAVHATQMTDTELVGLAESGAVAGLCPITEANLGDGMFPGANFLRAGGRFGVGSDSNVHVTLFGELSMLEYSQRLRDRGRAVLADERSTGRVLFEEVARGGAQAAARGSGGLAVGQVADILGVESDNEFLCGRGGDAALDTLIFGGRGRECIREVWSAGRHVVKGGRHLTRGAIVQRFRGVMDELGQGI